MLERDLKQRDKLEKKNDSAGNFKVCCKVLTNKGVQNIQRVVNDYIGAYIQII